MKRLPIPSPTPDLVPVVKVMYPQIYSLFSHIPETWVFGVLAFFGGLIGKTVYDKFMDHSVQSTKATISNMFLTFTEKHNENMRKQLEEWDKKHTEHMIEIVKLTHAQEQALDLLMDLKKSSDYAYNKLGDHEKRIFNVERKL